MTAPVPAVDRLVDDLQDLSRCADRLRTDVLEMRTALLELSTRTTGAPATEPAPPPEPARPAAPGAPVPAVPPQATSPQATSPPPATPQATSPPPATPTPVPPPPRRHPFFPDRPAAERPPSAPPSVPPAPLAPPGTPAAPVARRTSWWEREGMVERVLGIVGAGVTLIGVTFLLVLAASLGWFGPVARVTLAGIVAAGLIVVATRVRRRDVASVGAVALAATGYAVAYLDIVAVAGHYRWIPPLGGIVLAALVAATGLVVALRWNTELLGLLVVLGAAALIPALTGGLTLDAARYLVVLGVASVVVHRDRSWPALQMARLAPAVLGTLAVLAELAPLRGTTLSTLLILGAALACCGAVTAAWMAIRFPRSAAIEGTALVLMAATVLPWASAATSLSRVPQTVAFALAAFGYALLAQPRSVLDRTGRYVATALFAVFLLAALNAGLDPDLLPAALLVTALTHLLVGDRYRSRVSGVVGAAYTLIGLAAIAASIPWLLSRADVWRLDALAPVEWALACAVVIAGHRALRTLWPVTPVSPQPQTSTPAGVSSWPEEPDLQRYRDRIAVTLVLLTGAATVVSTGVLAGSWLGDVDGGFVAGHALATLAWIAVAAVLLIRRTGRRAGRRPGAWTGYALALAGAGVAKLFLFDLATLSGIARVAAFTLTGLALLAMATRYGRSGPAGAPEPVQAEGRGDPHADADGPPDEVGTATAPDENRPGPMRPDQT